jgi:L-histidine N-alpha-methyltransferase
MSRTSTEERPQVDVVGTRDDGRAALYEATFRSLQAEPKELPTVWLYDERGSRLYEEITRLPAYYLPRRESEVLRARAQEIARRTKATTLAELGAGSANNTRVLLDALGAAGALERFVPLDVSGKTLQASAETIAAAYPRIAVQAIVGDFEHDLGLLPRGGRRLIAFLGSTIGNLYPDQRARLLGALADELSPGDSLLIGIDLVKDSARLEEAYNDPGGVTEAFVRNALTAANRELEATFDQRQFAYVARWDPAKEWMDIGFHARETHTVSVRRLGLELTFEEAEPLRVEISSKFRRERFEREAARAGLAVASWWTDRAGDFAVALVLPTSTRSRTRFHRPREQSAARS